MKRLVVLVVCAAVAVMVRVDCAMAQSKAQGLDAPSIKQVLLDPKGFDMHYSCHSRTGWSRVFFHEEGKKILADITVVEIKNVDINKTENFMLESCTGNADLTEGGIMFTGCNDECRNIFLAYDPGNRKTAFKGSGRDCPSIELCPR